MEMDLFVQICNGETLKIPMKPSFTIKEIKVQIQSLKDISMESQTLTLNGDVLENDMTLSISQIENSILWLTYQARSISIHLYQNCTTKKETFKTTIGWNYSIQNIKKSIEKFLHYPQSIQYLYLGNGKWSNEAKLGHEESLADR